MKISEAIAARIRHYLKEKDLTQYRLGLLTSIPHNTMQDIVHARYDSMNTRNLFLIIKAFDLTIPQFFSDPSFDLNETDIE